MSQQKIHDESSFKRILKAYNSPDTSKAEKEFLEFIFPELTESEDEKIREKIIDYLKNRKVYTDAIEDSWISWLEKQKQVEWSEEDEKILKLILENLTELKNCYGEKYGKCGNCIDWLKSLKDRVQPQPKQEWSEEDEKRIERIVSFIWKNRKGDTDEIYQQEQDAIWLRSLKS